MNNDEDFKEKKELVFNKNHNRILIRVEKGIIYEIVGCPDIDIYIIDYDEPVPTLKIYDEVDNEN